MWQRNGEKDFKQNPRRYCNASRQQSCGKPSQFLDKPENTNKKQERCDGKPQHFQHCAEKRECSAISEDTREFNRLVGRNRPHRTKQACENQQQGGNKRKQTSCRLTMLPEAHLKAACRSSKSNCGQCVRDKLSRVHRCTPIV